MTDSALVVLQSYGLAGWDEDDPSVGQYLLEADVEANEGRGAVTWTPEEEKARRFTSMAVALDYWARQSTTVPLRPDGKPNRPLTAYTVCVRPIGIRAVVDGDPVQPVE